MNVTIVKSDPRAREKPCLRCGYSLRKILDSTHCPECGLSIWLSLNQNDSLDWSNPEWIKKISLATWILGLVQVIGLAALILLWREHPPRPAPAFNNDGTLIGPTMISAPPKPWWGTGLVAGTYLVLYNSGLILLAVDEGRYPNKWRSARWACRIAGGLGMVIGLFVILSGGELLFKISLLSSGVATFYYLRQIAKRIPSALLSRICGILLFTPLLTLFKTVPVLWYFAVFGLFNVIDYLPWIYLPASAVVLIWFGVLLKRHIQVAMEGWQKETAGHVVKPTEPQPVVSLPADP